MSVRLREAEAQAELRETRQRMLEMETQVRPQPSINSEAPETLSHANLQRAAVALAENFTAATSIFLDELLPLVVGIQIKQGSSC